MPLPIRKTRKLRKNAPAWAGGVAAAVSLVLTASADVPGWARGVIAVAVVVGGVASQFYTRPDED